MSLPGSLHIRSLFTASTKVFSPFRKASNGEGRKEEEKVGLQREGKRESRLFLQLGRSVESFG